MSESNEGSGDKILTNTKMHTGTTRYAVILYIVVIGIITAIILAIKQYVSPDLSIKNLTLGLAYTTILFTIFGLIAYLFRDKILEVFSDKIKRFISKGQVPVIQIFSNLVTGDNSKNLENLSQFSLYISQEYFRYKSQQWLLRGILLLFTAFITLLGTTVLVKQNNLLESQNSLLRAEAQPNFDLRLERKTIKLKGETDLSIVEVKPSGTKAFNTMYNSFHFIEIEIISQDQSIYHKYWPIANYAGKYVADTILYEDKFVYIQGIPGLNKEKVSDWLEEAFQEFSEGQSNLKSAQLNFRIRSFLSINYIDVFDLQHHIVYETTPI